MTLKWLFTPNCINNVSFAQVFARTLKLPLCNFFMQLLVADHPRAPCNRIALCILTIAHSIKWNWTLYIYATMQSGSPVLYFWRLLHGILVKSRPFGLLSQSGLEFCLVTADMSVVKDCELEYCIVYFKQLLWISASEHITHLLIDGLCNCGLHREGPAWCSKTIFGLFDLW